MEEKLKQAKSMNDVIRIAQEHYDLDQPLGVASKIIVISGLKVAIKTINAKPKK